jgi:hypothetical protein
VNLDRMNRLGTLDSRAVHVAGDGHGGPGRPRRHVDPRTGDLIEAASAAVVKRDSDRRLGLLAGEERHRGDRVDVRRDRGEAERAFG